jgi:hypothetical protein
MVTRSAVSSHNRHGPGTRSLARPPGRPGGSAPRQLRATRPVGVPARTLPPRTPAVALARHRRRQRAHPARALVAALVVAATLGMATWVTHEAEATINRTLASLEPAAVDAP